MTRRRGLLQAQGVGVAFGPVRALQGVNLSLEAGERLALIGGNGSGKSTLLRVLHGLQAPSEGRVVFDAPVRKAMLFQRPFILRSSVLDNAALGLRAQGLPVEEARAQARVALQLVELDAVAGRNARTLSGGQQQRLALARAWCLRPDVLLLDEPTANLDPHGKREVESLLARLAPITLVFASHNLGQVKRLATRVLCLEQGKVVADLPVAEFFNTAQLQAEYPSAYAFSQGESG
ncbi:MAG: hypothetical protein RLZZ126_1106 [Pseudomonadota bacterium]|jgi:tungstate transport system ATP-binding protein